MKLDATLISTVSKFTGSLLIPHTACRNRSFNELSTSLSTLDPMQHDASVEEEKLCPIDEDEFNLVVFSSQGLCWPFFFRCQTYLSSSLFNLKELLESE
ncbi:hypothetical protein CDAR_262971 [Caerostris darwini]|uniref:Uncharacterized protein n=1 Tax=Caerostris darwini TaxID=1538125 RepID=A0AAV4RUL6_9ARAC|nr:hypothetical protein CDAR_262971 [Caerostris darwini]